jgi:hypothetical protein
MEDVRGRLEGNLGGWTVGGGVKDHQHLDSSAPTCAFAGDSQGGPNPVARLDSAGTARRLAAHFGGPDVPPAQWYFRLHGRTRPDLAISAARCAILHSEAHPPIRSCLPTMPQTCRQGFARDSGPVRVGQWVAVPGPGQDKRDGVHGGSGRPGRATLGRALRPLRR